jgi:hypothetical protein
VARGVDHLIDTVGGPDGYRFLPMVKLGGTISPVFFVDYHPGRVARLGATFTEAHALSWLD